MTSRHKDVFTLLPLLWSPSRHWSIDYNLFFFFSLCIFHLFYFLREQFNLEFWHDKEWRILGSSDGRIHSDPSGSRTATGKYPEKTQIKGCKPWAKIGSGMNLISLQPPKWWEKHQWGGQGGMFVQGKLAGVKINFCFSVPAAPRTPWWPFL